MVSVDVTRHVYLHGERSKTAINPCLGIMENAVSTRLCIMENAINPRLTDVEENQNVSRIDVDSMDNEFAKMTDSFEHMRKKTDDLEAKLELLSIQFRQNSLLFFEHSSVREDLGFV